MELHVLDMFKITVELWIFVYGFSCVLNGLFVNTLFFTLISILSMLLFFYFLRIPKPNKAAVEAVVGKDPINDHGLNNGNHVLKVIAHRGAGLDAPENSLVAFKMCAEKYCQGIEFDVTLSADNIPVVFHDDNLERLTDIPTEIKHLSYHNLSKIDISVKHPLKEKFVNTRIPTLEECVNLCISNQQKMVIDIKNDDIRMVNIILELFKKYANLESHAMCSSFYPRIIYKIRRSNPKIVCSLAYRPHFFAYQSFSGISGKGLPRSKNFLKHNFLKCLDIVYTWALPRIIYYVVGISVILLHKDYISGKILNDWREKGIRVIAWTVNHPIEKQHFSRNLKITYMTDTLIGESTAHQIFK